MNIQSLTLGPLQVSCYIVYVNQKCLIIDPGFEPERIMAKCDELGLKIEAVLLTHGHFDHVGGVKAIARQTGCQVYICKEDLALKPALTAGAISYTDTYSEGDVLEVAGLRFRVLHTPGHTPGSVCLVCGDTIFSGDTLFAGTCGRTDLPGGDMLQILRSLARLAQLEGDYRVLPGHGEESTLEQERRSNPFMQRL